MVITDIYCVPYSTINLSDVCTSKKNLEPTRPSTAKTSALTRARKIPFLAMVFACSNFFSPRLLESRALIPTPVPVATAIIRFCTGKARETAVSASSFNCATNILSTILYSACTSMDKIIGRDMEIKSLGMGSTPILFSFIIVSDINKPPSNMHRYSNTNYAYMQLYFFERCTN